MFLIIGLGNPGKKYALTRHNTGFMLADKLRKTWNLPDFSFEKKFNAEISKGVYEPSTTNRELLLAKPATFMNNSGEAVKKIMDFYKLTPADMIVIHDDLDIPLGKYKIVTNSRAAGHNGVQDIIDKLGTQNFKRIRIGIGKSETIPAEDYVLQEFTFAEREIIQKVFDEIISSLSKNTGLIFSVIV